WRTGCGQDGFQIHSVERRIDLASIRVFIQRRGEVEFYRAAIGRGDQSFLYARLGRPNVDVPGYRADDRVAQTECFGVHVAGDDSLLDRSHDTAFKFEIADELRFVLLDVTSRGLGSAGELNQLLGGS